MTVPRSAIEGAGGLTSSEAAARLGATGANLVTREEASSALGVLLRQFASPLVWLLLVAAVVSAKFGDLADGIAIGTIVALNTLVGFLQEYRAERAVMALRGMSAPRARVLRDGHAAATHSCSRAVTSWPRTREWSKPTACWRRKRC
jgi:Ca2+-transporting ATPase